MAILPVNQMIQNPDFAGSLQQGIQFGQQQRAVKQQIADKNQLRTLAPQIIAGDPTAYDQAAAINPEAADAYQGAGDNQLRRLKGFITYVDQARASGKPEAVNAALQAGSGFLGRFIGKPGPTQWTPDMEPGWEQLKAKVAMLDGAGLQGRVQSTYVDDKGQRVAIMADGTQKVLGGNDAGMSQQTISIPGADGRPRQYTFDKRTGNYVPAGQEDQAPVPTNTEAPAPTGPRAGLGSDHQANYQNLARQFGAQISSTVRTPERNAAVGGVPNSQHLRGTAADFVVPQESKPQFIAAARQQGYEALDEGDHIHLELPPGQQVASVGGSPFVGRTPEEEAAAVARAKGEVELGNLPRELDMRTNAAVDQAVRSDVGKADAERAALARSTLPQARADANELLGLIRTVKSSTGLADLSGLSGLNPLNKVPGSAATDAQVMLDQVKGKAFLQAFASLKGAGAITEQEGQKATEAIARLNTRQSDEAMLQSLDDLAGVVQRGLAKAEQQARGGSAAPSASGGVRRARNPQTGQVLVLVNGQWVPE